MSLYAAQQSKGITCPVLPLAFEGEGKGGCYPPYHELLAGVGSGWMTAGRRQAYQTLVQSLFCSCFFL